MHLLVSSPECRSTYIESFEEIAANLLSSYPAEMRATVEPLPATLISMHAAHLHTEWLTERFELSHPSNSKEPQHCFSALATVHKDGRSEFTSLEALPAAQARRFLVQKLTQSMLRP